MTVVHDEYVGIVGHVRVCDDRKISYGTLKKHANETGVPNRSICRLFQCLLVYPTRNRNHKGIAKYYNTQNLC